MTTEQVTNALLYLIILGVVLYTSLRFIFPLLSKNDKNMKHLQEDVLVEIRSMNTHLADLKGDLKQLIAKLLVVCLFLFGACEKQKVTVKIINDPPQTKDMGK